MHAQRGASLLTFSISRFWNTRKQKNEIGSHLNIYTSAAAFSAGQKGRGKHAIQAERFSTPTCLQWIFQIYWRSVFLASSSMPPRRYGRWQGKV